MQNLIIVAAIVFVINLFFGYWRGGYKKMTLWWFVAIHAPIPIVIYLRYLFEIGFAPYTYFIIIPTFVVAQWIGDRYRRGELKSIWQKFNSKMGLK